MTRALRRPGRSRAAAAGSPRGRRPILLVPDTGPAVGLGHVGRCAALAQALAERGWDFRIAVTDLVSTRFLRALGLRTTRSFSGRWSAVVFDSYRVPPRAMRALRRRGCPVIAIDDLHQLRRRDADLLLRPALGERSRGGSAGGADYILLRREYWRRPPRLPSRVVRRVAVAMGAYPDRDTLARVVRLLREVLPDVHVSVVTSQRSPSRAIGDARVRLVRGVTSLLPVLGAADLAVTAGGQSMNEALASGTPTVVLGMAANQRRNVAAARRGRAAAVVGWSTDRLWPSRFRRSVARLAARWPLRRQLALTAQRLVDGRGALRVARLLERLLSSSAPDCRPARRR